MEFEVQLPKEFRMSERIFYEPSIDFRTDEDCTYYSVIYDESQCNEFGKIEIKTILNEDHKLSNDFVLRSNDIVSVNEYDIMVKRDNGHSRQRFLEVTQFEYFVESSKILEIKIRQGELEEDETFKYVITSAYLMDYDVFESRIKCVLEKRPIPNDNWFLRRLRYSKNYFSWRFGYYAVPEYYITENDLQTYLTTSPMTISSHYDITYRNVVVVYDKIIRKWYDKRMKEIKMYKYKKDELERKKSEFTEKIKEEKWSSFLEKENTDWAKSAKHQRILNTIRKLMAMQKEFDEFEEPIAPFLSA